MKRWLFIFLGSVHFCLAQDVTFDVFFDLGKYRLSAKHTQKIDAQLASLDTTNTYNFIIKGYTDFVDTQSFNLKLSHDRAISVSKYIQKQYEPLINSLEKEAKGEIATDSSHISERIGIQQHRRVSVVITQNDHKPKVTTRKENIFVVPTNELRVGNSYAFGKINFKVGRVTLIKSSKKELEKLVRFLRKNRTIHIEIQGHVCCGGEDDSDALNSDTGTQTLSVDRARFVYQYLINRGISEKRLSYKGYAFTSPLYYPEKGNRDRGANRRVEIKIVKK